MMGSRVSGSAIFPRRYTPGAAIWRRTGWRSRNARLAPPTASAAPPAKASRRFHVLPNAMRTFYHAPRQIFAGFLADSSMLLRGGSNAKDGFGGGGHGRGHGAWFGLGGRARRRGRQHCALRPPDRR